MSEPLEILQIGHPRLREPARELSPEEIRSPAVQELIDAMIRTMRAAKGAGLAATQVGEGVRICVIEVGENPRYPYKPKIPLTILLNPVVEALSEETFANYEGCLSVPDLRGVVRRHTEIRVRALDREGEPFSREVRGLSAGTFQHELDHLDGLLFVDRVEDSRSLSTWAQFEAHHRAAFVQRVEELVARYGS